MRKTYMDTFINTHTDRHEVMHLDINSDLDINLYYIHTLFPKYTF